MRPAFVFLLVYGLPGLARAQIPVACGPDCASPGRYVLCHDSFDTSHQTGGGAELTEDQEAVCATFQPPAASFKVAGFVGLFGPGDLLISLVEVWNDTGTVRPPPPVVYSEGAGIPDSNKLGFVPGLFQSPPTMTQAFRLCIKQQLPDQIGIRPVAFDADGEQGVNWSFVGSLGGWARVGTRGLNADFVLRAIIEGGDPAPWEAGGACVTPDAGVLDAGAAEDAGFTPDAGAAMDAGAARDAEVTPDAGVARDAEVTPDGGVARDAEVTQDAEVTRDAGVRVDAGVIRDAEVVDGGARSDAEVDAGAREDAGAPAPVVERVAPNHGANTAAVDIVVIGDHFAEGAKVTLATIALNAVDVVGPTTILAQVPAQIAPGTYDLSVENPDHQKAVLSSGYTVTAEGGVVEDGCGCRGTSGGPAWLGLLVLLIGLRRRRVSGR